ncbi:hypothetical protein ACFXTH_045749 [Malus domestica]
MRANTYKAQGQPSRRRCGILQSTPLRETDVLVGTPNGRESGSDTKQCNHAFLRRDIVRFVVEPGAPVRPHSRICFCKPQLQNASLKSTCERIHIRPKDSPHVVDVGYYNQQCNHAFLRRDIVRFVVEPGAPYMRANTYKAQGQPSRRRCGILQSTPLRETDVLVGTPNGRESGSDTKQCNHAFLRRDIVRFVVEPGAPYMRANTYKAQGQPSRRRCGILQSTPLRETDVLVGTPNGRESGSDTKQCNHAFLRRDIVRFVVEPGAPVRPHSRICFCKPQLQNASLKSTCERIHIRPKDSPHVVDVGYYRSSLVTVAMASLF